MRKLPFATGSAVAILALGALVVPASANAADTTTYVSNAKLDSHVIFQDFSFFQPYESNTYTTLTQKASALKDLGITDVWMAPAYRALDAYNEEGYAVTDRYDLGEFPAGHNGATATKYGTSDELKTAISTLHAQGLKVQEDIVPNQIYSYQDREVVPVTAVDQYGNESDSSIKNKLYEIYSVSGGAGQQKYGVIKQFKSADLNGLTPQDGLGADRVMLDADGKPYRYTGGSATAGSNYLPDGMGAGEGDALNVNNLDGYLTVDGYFIAGKTASGGDIWRPNLMYYTEHQAGAVNISYLDYVRANPPVGSGITTDDTDDQVRTKLIAASDSAVSNTTNDYIGSQPGYNGSLNSGITALRIDKNTNGGNLDLTAADGTPAATEDNSDVNKNLLQYEFLIGQDVDNSNADVKADTTNWENFLLDDYGFDGFRWDAAGHYNKDVLTDAGQLFSQRAAANGTDPDDSLNYIESYVSDQKALENDNGNPQLAYDTEPYYAYLGALGSAHPTEALSDTETASMVNRVYPQAGEAAIPNWSFVTNHDTEHNVMATIPVTDAETGGAAYGTKQYQLAQYKLYSEDRKKVTKNYAPYNIPAAYALELTNKDTVPTVFYGDMWEATDSYMTTKTPYYDAISKLLAMRKTNASGAQTITNYVTSPGGNAGQSLMASVRAGTSRDTGVGVVVGNNSDLNNTIQVDMGADHANQEYVDALGYHDETLTTDADGVLTVLADGSKTVQVNGYLAAWVPKTADTATATPTATATTDPTATTEPKATADPTATTDPTTGSSTSTSGTSTSGTGSDAPTPAPAGTPAPPAKDTSTSTNLLVASPKVVYGKSSTLAASVDIAATGTITFRAGSKKLGTTTVSSGLATLQTSATLKPGTYHVTAVYSGDADHAASSSSAGTLTVAKATTKATAKLTRSGAHPKLRVHLKSLSSGAAVTGKVRITAKGAKAMTVRVTKKAGGSVSIRLPKRFASATHVKARFLGTARIAKTAAVKATVVTKAHSSK